ncbi:dynein axonemal intermediate chain 3-like [Protopterus annectens]|uniref:dynein axonemal intermediate chain 3-like n=1 Tax=Protopterus annectens TaxID=7888 RepID=UPI001CFB7E77|nr:dynein axonemal intermediate chain 3-like [Protopterus annectens]
MPGCASVTLRKASGHPSFMLPLMGRLYSNSKLKKCLPVASKMSSQRKQTKISAEDYGKLIENNLAKPGAVAEHPTKTPTVRYCAVSSIEHGHRAVVTDIYWLPEYYEVSRMGIPHENKNGICVQLVTCSPDGSVLFWDIRPPKVTAQSMLDKKKAEEKQLKNPHGVPTTFKHLDLTWKPIMKVTLPKIDSSGEYNPVVMSIRDDQELPPNLSKPEKSEAIDYSALRVPSARNLKLLENISTKFFVGSEDGELVYSEWRMEKDSDSGKLISSKPSYRFAVHDGILHTVQRSPFFKDIILTVGGWTFAIWKEGVTTGPILQSACSPKMYTAAQWSLSRAGIFFLGKEDGNIDVWDLLEKTHEPSQTQNISTAPITCIKPWIVTSKQHLLAVADDYGTLHILQIPWTLRHPSSHERLGIQHYFEREVKRLDYFTERKILHAKEKVQMEAEEQRKKNIILPPQKTEEQLDDELKTDYESYLTMEKNILTTLGIVTESEEKTQIAV